jgi:hypothetical protein
MPLLIANDVAPLKSEFVELLEAWKSGQDLSQYPLAAHWLYHEVVKGVALEWLGHTIAQLNWYQIRAVLQDKYPLPADVDALTRATYHWISATEIARNVFQHATDMQEWAYERVQEWCNAPIRSQQNHVHLNQFVNEVLQLHLDAVQWDTTLIRLKQQGQDGKLGDL